MYPRLAVPLLIILLTALYGTADTVDGLSVVIDFDERPIRIMAAYPTSIDTSTKANTLEESGDKDVTQPDSEPHIVLAVLTEDDSWLPVRVLKQNAVFYDEWNPADDRLEGGLFVGRNIHLLHIPTTRAVVAVDIPKSENKKIDLPEPVGIFVLGDQEVGLPDFKLGNFAFEPKNGDIIRVPIEGLRMKQAERPTLIPKRIAGTLAPEHAFDIVVMGDGFTLAELPRLEERIKDLAVRLLGREDDDNKKGMRPFSDPGIRDLVSIHFVPVASPQSGISGCNGANRAVESALRVRGDYNREGPSVFNTSNYKAIHEAARLVDRDLQNLEVFLVVVNCKMYGGTGYRSTSSAFVAWEERPDIFAGLAAHEMAHAIARLTDEYKNCAIENDLTVSYKNLAIPSQVNRDGLPITHPNQPKIWWTALAYPDELTHSGHLKYREFCGGPRQPDDTFGLYWGTTVIDMNYRDDRCDRSNDRRHCAYFRPQRTCKMKHVMREFCRVCQYVLRNAICDAADPQRNLIPACKSSVVVPSP